MTTVDGEDWAGRHLTDTWEGVTFLECDLEGASSEGATFEGCTFKGVRFNGSTHTASAFVSCTFLRCTFFDTTFAGCKLIGSTFERCDLDVLRVQGGDWSFTTLSAADLRKARFEGVRLREADLGSVKGAGMTLSGCDLSGAWLAQADLSKADLRGSDLSALNPLEVSVAGARITPVQAVTIALGLGFDVRDD